MMPGKHRDSAQARRERLTQIQQHLEELAPDDLQTEYETFFLTATEESFDPDVLDLYLAQLDKVAPLESEISTEASLAAFKEKHAVLLEDLETTKTTPKRRRAARFAVLAAAVAAIMGLLIAQVSGWNWIGTFARWTSETFGFSTRDYAVVTQWDPEYDALRAALRENGVPETLVPKYLPDGYKMVELDVDVEGWYNASFSDGIHSIFIRIGTPKNAEGNQIEKNNENPEVYVVGNTEHYLMTNTDTMQIVATWKADPYECLIIGASSEETMKQMINSIYTEAK